MLIFINLAPSTFITEVILIRWLKEQFSSDQMMRSECRILETKGTLGDLPQNHSSLQTDKSSQTDIK